MSLVLGVLRAIHLPVKSGEGIYNNDGAGDDDDDVKADDVNDEEDHA